MAVSRVWPPFARRASRRAAAPRADRPPCAAVSRRRRRLDDAMTSEPSTLFDDLDLPRPVPGGDVDERGIPLWATADGGADTAGGPGRPTDSDGRLHAPEELLKGLNPQQREAVVHDGPPLLIVAGAGSGKTRVLTHRIAYLLAARNIQPGQVLAITFTNKAAGEMKERVADLIGPRAKAMWVMTFHSACVRILRREATRLGLKSTFSIYDAADSQRLMTLVLRDLDLDPKRYQPRAFSHAVSNLKNDLVDEETYASRVGAEDGPGTHHERMVAQAYTMYQRRLRQANAMDFDDLIMSTVHLLQAFERLEQMDGRPDEVVEVHGVGLAKPTLVHRVGLRDHPLVVRAGAVLGTHARRIRLLVDEVVL